MIFHNQILYNLKNVTWEIKLIVKIISTIYRMPHQQLNIVEQIYLFKKVPSHYTGLGQKIVLKQLYYGCPYCILYFLKLISNIYH